MPLPHHSLSRRATPAVSGSVLTLTPKASGTAAVTVRATNAAGGYAELTFNVTVNLGAKTSMSLYPNPASDQLNISLTTTYNGSADARIYDSAARLVWEGDLTISQGSGVLAVSKLAAGNYFLEIQYEDVRVRSAFMKL